MKKSSVSSKWIKIVLKNVQNYTIFALGYKAWTNHVSKIWSSEKEIIKEYLLFPITLYFSDFDFDLTNSQVYFVFICISRAARSD